MKNFHWINFLQRTLSLQQLRDHLQAAYAGVSLDTVSTISIIGAAEEGQRLLHLCDSLGIAVACVCDDHPEKQGLIIGRHTIQPTHALAQIDKHIPVVIASHRVWHPMRLLKKQGFFHVLPFALLQILEGDRFPPHPFYKGWFEALFEYRDSIDSFLQLLQDERSLEVFNAILGFRLTLNPEYLTSVIEWDLYGPNALLQYTDREVYIDGGAFDGDTIHRFIERMNGKFEKIIGFEPDRHTFQTLQQRFHRDTRVTVLNKGLYSQDDILYFDHVGTRASTFTEVPDCVRNTEKNDSVVSVPVTSIDTVLSGERVTYIKMNIEGAEIPALHGSAHSIAKYKPKLGISVYHRPTDLWGIPLLIKTLNPEYQCYLRQHDGGVIESVVYGV